MNLAWRVSALTPDRLVSRRRGPPKRGKTQQSEEIENEDVVPYGTRGRRHRMDARELRDERQRHQPAGRGAGGRAVDRAGGDGRCDRGLHLWLSARDDGDD